MPPYKIVFVILSHKFQYLRGWDKIKSIFFWDKKIKSIWYAPSFLEVEVILSCDKRKIGSQGNRQAPVFGLDLPWDLLLLLRINSKSVLSWWIFNLLLRINSKENKGQRKKKREHCFNLLDKVAHIHMVLYPTFSFYSFVGYGRRTTKLSTSNDNNKTMAPSVSAPWP